MRGRATARPFSRECGRGRQISVLRSGTVTLETTTPSSPGVIRATDREGYTHVVMPMFVQW